MGGRMTEERKIQLVAEVDATRAREGFNEIGQQAGQMAATVTRTSEQAGRAVDGIGNGAATSSAKVDAAQRNMIGSIQRTTAQMEAGSRTSAKYYEVLAQQRGVDPAALAPYLAQLRQVEAAQLRVNAATNDSNTGLRNVGVSAGQTAAALRNVPAQFTDIITSLQGGQAPLTVLIQQGGQLADMFGGVGQAAQAMGSYIRGLINPYTVTAAVVAGLAITYRAGAKEADAYAISLATTGNAAGGTIDQLAEMARAVGEISGSQGAAAGAVAALAGTGQVAVENMQKFALAATEAQKIIGRSVEDTAADFASLKDAPLSALGKINEKYHFITAATYAQVKALQDQGRASEAATVAQNAYADAVLNQRDKVMSSLSDWERGWIRIKSGVSGAVDAVLDFGRAATNSEKIGSLLQTRETIEANLAGAQQKRDTKAAAAWQVQLDRNKEEINSLRGKTDAERAAAKAAADAADVAEAKNKWLEAGDKYLDRETKKQREITKARNEGAAAQLSTAEIEKRVADIRKSYEEKSTDGIDARLEALKRQDAVAEVIARRELARIAALRAAGSMGEDEAISTVASAEISAMDRERSSLEGQLVLMGRKKDSLREQAALRGQIAVVNERQTSRELQLESDLAASEQRRSRLAADNYAKVIDSATALRDGLVSQVRAQLDANEQIGLEATALGELAAVRLESIAARKDEEAEISEGLDLSGRYAEIIREEADALRSRATAMREGGVKKDSFEAGKDLDKFFDPAKAQSFGDALRGAFDSAGDSLGRMTSALQAYGIRQSEIEEARKNANLAYANDSQRLAAVSMQITRKEAQGRIGSYADMTGAAKGFFKEGSKGYSALESAEKAFRAFEMAMMIKSMVTSLFVSSTKATGAVAGQTVETGAVVAGEAERNAAKVPGVFMSFMSALGPWGMAAAGVAIAAVLGSAFSGNGGAPSSEQRQETQGTGSVFGDKSAKSESIARSIELSAANSSIELNYTQGMLRALLGIQNSLQGLGNLLIRGSGITSDVPATTYGGMEQSARWIAGYDNILGGFVGKATGAIMNGIFGGKTKALDTGLMANKVTVEQAKAGGLQASQYLDTKKDGGLFHSDKYRTSYTALGDEASAQFSKIISNMSGAIGEAGKLLGMGGDAFTQRLNNFVVDIGKISLKDLTGEEIQKELESVFSKLGDDMAKYAVSGLASFQKVGEGYLETLTRVATNYSGVGSIFESIGKEIDQTVTKTITWFSWFGGSIQTPLTMVKTLSIEARERLVDLFGGLDEMASKHASFADNFLSEAERLAPVTKYVASEMSKLGFAGINTRDQFKSLALGLDVSTQRGAEQYASLMMLADAFAKTHAATVDLTKSQQAIADERADLQDQLDELTMSSIQLLNKQRMALDASNRGLFDQIEATKAAKAAQDAAKTSLGDVINKMKSFGDSARGLSAGLVTGNLSTLTPEQQYAELERQYQTTRVAGIAGDTKAQANFSSIAQSFLTASQKINGGDARYGADFAGVIRDSEEIAKWTTSQVDVAQASLDAMNAQVAGIATLNETMLLVAQGVGAMPSSAIPVPDYSSMGTSDKDALVAEVRALRTSNESLAAEVKGLRADQQKQTGDLITSNATVTADGAKTVVAGIGNANVATRLSNFRVNLNAY